MNRIAGRAVITLVLVFALLGGMIFFVGEYGVASSEWVLSAGSPHVYSGGKTSTVLTDANGTLLADLTGNWTYSTDPVLRRAVLHWTGDRQGNVSTAYLQHFAKEMSGYDFLNGVYTYGEGNSKTALTLYADVQKAALEALGNLHGTVAVYNYKTGDILCAVSTPSFDPDNVPDIAGDTSGSYNGVYLNRFLQSSYIPGSIFKIVTAAAALETIPDIGERTFTCTHTYELEGGQVTCEGWHGEQTMEQALANSCNCAFAQIVELLGADVLERYVEQFQILAPLTFDGITTAGGNFEVDGASQVNVAWSGIGQYKDLVNPCRYMTFLGAIAGGGSGAEPHIISRITIGGATTYAAGTQTSPQLMSADTAEILRAYLRNNVQTVYGDGNFPGLTVCGKSGTGEVGDGQKPNAMFTGFVADEAYPLAFLVAVEEGGYGSQTCVPILSRVLAECKRVLDQTPHT